MLTNLLTFARRVFTDVLSMWIDQIALARCDSAVCSTSCREIILDIMKDHFILSTISREQYKMQILPWAFLRSLRIIKIELDSNSVASLVSSAGYNNSSTLSSIKVLRIIVYKKSTKKQLQQVYSIMRNSQPFEIYMQTNVLNSQFAELNLNQDLVEIVSKNKCGLKYICLQRMKCDELPQMILQILENVPQIKEIEINSIRLTRMNNYSKSYSLARGKENEIDTIVHMKIFLKKFRVKFEQSERMIVRVELLHIARINDMTALANELQPSSLTSAALRPSMEVEWLTAMLKFEEKQTNITSLTLDFRWLKSMPMFNFSAFLGAVFAVNTFVKLEKLELTHGSEEVFTPTAVDSLLVNLLGRGLKELSVECFPFTDAWQDMLTARAISPDQCTVIANLDTFPRMDTLSIKLN